MPAGRDVSVSHLIPYRTDFYSHARKGRDKFAEISGNQFRDLYSHTHMGHDQYFLAVQTASVISTHRPTGGVTGHDGNVFTDDGKPKDIIGASGKHGGADSLPEHCMDG